MTKVSLRLYILEQCSPRHLSLFLCQNDIHRSMTLPRLQGTVGKQSKPEENTFFVDTKVAARIHDKKDVQCLTLAFKIV